jgi:coenzyme PQQ precursor peptide PqqA
VLKVFEHVPLIEFTSAARQLNATPHAARGGRHMVWTTPTLVEICIGLEINGYLPAEF